MTCDCNMCHILADALKASFWLWLCSFPPAVRLVCLREGLLFHFRMMEQNVNCPRMNI